MEIKSQLCMCVSVCPICVCVCLINKLGFIFDLLEYYQFLFVFYIINFCLLCSISVSLIKHYLYSSNKFVFLTIVLFKQPSLFSNGIYS